MTGPERVARSDIRYNPFTHVVIEPYNIPSSPKSSKKKDDAPQPPRPQNAWILYRAWALNDLLERQPELKGTPQSQLSKILGTQWANESPDIRKHFEHQANLNKERHAQEFPDYVFKPQKKEEKERERERKKQEKARDREAAKLRKEVERNMRAGYLPPFMMSRPTIEVLQKLAFIKFADLGPSPPISQCPSPETMSVSIDDESVNVVSQDTSSSSTIDLTLSEGELATTSVSVPATSEVQFSICSSDVDQQSVSIMSSVATPSQPDSAMLVDAPMASGSSSDGPIDWSKYGISSMSDIEAFINKAFPSEATDSEPNQFEMPSGNIVPSPGCVDRASQANVFDFSGLVSIPLDESAGMLDDQYDCHLANPHAEQDSSFSNSHDQAQQESKEALFLEPFVQLDVSLGHLLSAGKEVGNTLLDEQEASANGERVMAAEHVQDGAPATLVERCAPSSFLPSPPESSSSATSPLAPGLFDFGGATNLCASSSNQDAFGSMGFSDSMSNTDTASSAWSLPSFSDYGGHDSFGFGSTSGDASTTTLRLSTNMEENARKSFPTGFFSGVPPTPVSATPWKSDPFDIGEIGMADFSSLSAAASNANDSQMQNEDAWLSSYFNEAGSGPV
ncbi:hypothetical protein ACEPAF_7425 [Sanghuangporus sanghuang]